ncbi:MAG: DNA primase [bacterium LCO1.1]|uniref:DNA primase n=1 Tax=Candidatus Weimeria bifida TaxID=2599074 RepID=A0A6N7J0K2_9FIRM|nr:DNA primase [Candidatus Weimeria bifida]
MSHYDQNTIEEVRRANDIVEVIGEYVPLKKSGSNYFGLCPFHSEKSPSFSVNPQRQMYHCFGCGASGTVYQFYENYLHMSFPEAVRALAQRAGITLKESADTPEQKRRRQRRDLLLAAQKEAAYYYYSLLHSDHGKACLAYFKKRGLSDKTMISFGLGYSDAFSDDLYRHLKKKGYKDDILKDTGLFTFDERGVRDKFFNRAMFPIMDQYSKVIGFGGRVMGDGQPKYLNSPETEIFDKSHTLYGLFLARRSRRGYFILCEGYMDVIALHQGGFDCAVASLGTSLTTGQVSVISRFTKDVYLSYDSDGAGIKAALRAIPMFRKEGITPRIIHMDPYKDPDEFIKAVGSNEYQKRIDEAENFFIFEIRQLQKNYDTTDPGMRTEFQREIAKKLCGFKEQLERDNYTDAVCKEFNIPVEAMRSLVKETAAQEIIKTSARARSRYSAGNQDPVRPHGKGPAAGTVDKSQSLLLSWVSYRPDLFEVVFKFLKPPDFQEGVLRSTAYEMYDQMQKSGIMNPAAIIDSFDEIEDQNVVSRIFHEYVRDLQATPKDERGRAFTQTLSRVVAKAYDERMNSLEATDVARFELVRQKNESLSEISKLHIPNA